MKNSTSLEFIWQTIRQHFGFHATGAQFIDIYRHSSREDL